MPSSELPINEPQAEPLVSVLTSTYRSSRFLKGFLENFESQSIFHLSELVLRVNEPTSNETRILDLFRKKYPRNLVVSIVSSVETLGASWNQAVAMAAGKYLTIWNVDDERFPESLEVSSQALEKHSAVGFVYGPYVVEKTRWLYHGRNLAGGSAIGKEALLSGMHLGPFFMFRSSLVGTLGPFDEQYVSAADFDFALRLARHSAGVRVDSVLGTFHDRGKGLSTSRSILQPVERTAVELRYGLFSQIKTRYLEKAILYDEEWIHCGGEPFPLGRYSPRSQRDRAKGKAVLRAMFHQRPRIGFCREILFKLFDIADNVFSKLGRLQHRRLERDY